jgi:hypothetical protein
MTNEELIAFLRDLPFLRAAKAADRIEQLVAINEAMTAKLATCEKYRDAYAECDSIGTQAVRDLEVKLAAAVDWFETIRDRAKGDYMAHTYYLDALAALATIEGLGVKQTG